MERRLLNPENVDILPKYNSIMKKLIDSGVAKYVPHSEGLIWYLPHHYVIYPNKPGKIRVVMDWAVQYSDFVLKKPLYRGPSLIPSLVGILLRT